jgi:hypothetical protein
MVFDFRASVKLGTALLGPFEVSGFGETGQMFLRSGDHS